MARKEVIKNICLTKEEANRVDSNAYTNNLSVSQYLADPPNMLYKVIPFIASECPIKLHVDDHMEHLKSKSDISVRYNRYLVQRILSLKEESPFKKILKLKYGQAYKEDYVGVIYIKLEDNPNDIDKV